ncbi:MAG: hypothetical protein IJM90_07710 [Firmicutes bacterium]|nr:hypothetical protein [Bacillota bacterium]
MHRLMGRTGRVLIALILLCCLLAGCTGGDPVSTETSVPADSVITSAEESPSQESAAESLPEESSFEPRYVKAFLASDRPQIELYRMTDRQLYEKTLCPRGTEVERIIAEPSAWEEQSMYTGILWEGQEYLIMTGMLAENPDEVVLEKSIYARTPATILTAPDDAGIAGLAKKTDKLDVLGYDYLNPDGSVHMYRVQQGENSGWVYAKYMVTTFAEAEPPYNEHGEYDIHKDRRHTFELYGGEGGHLDYYPVEKPVFEDNPFCEDARTMYLNARTIFSLDDYLAIIRESGVNAVVLDIKDGYLGFAADAAREACPTGYADAYATAEDYAAAVSKLQDNGLYVIGRIVVFNDWAFAADHPEACILTDVTSEKWVSAYNRDAWEYNCRLAIEAVEKCGFNEIQFDYVRFPDYAYSMSAEGKTDFRNAYDEEKAQTIQNFLFYVCDQLHERGVYVSVDVFGECSNTYVSAPGQYWPAISNVVDAISSMPYTDHFSTSVDMWTDPYPTVYQWALKAAERQTEIPTPAVPRTWITGYDTPYWNPVVEYDASKIKAEAQALYDAGLTGGFIPWNAGSSLSKYKQISEAWKNDYTGSD